MRDIMKAVSERVLVFDGSKGTMLQRAGLKGGECAELWNIERGRDVKNVLESYKKSGSDVVQTCTFQSVKLKEFGLGDRVYEINLAASKLAREAVGEDGYVVADIGPIGVLFEPSGKLTFDEAYRIFSDQLKGFMDGGVDAVNFETFTDLAEMRAALLAAKENCSLPVICSMSYEANGRTLMGNTPYICALVLKSMGADMIGTNCSLGPEHLLNAIREMGKAGDIPLVVKPNAGLPELVDGNAVYRESPENFSKLSKEFVNSGVVLIGGCCGTTPEFIRAVSSAVKGMRPVHNHGKDGEVICSSSKMIRVEDIDREKLGRIDSRADKEVAEAAAGRDFDFFTDKAIELSGEGYDTVYVRIDNCDGDTLAGIVNNLQAYLKEPMILEAEAGALEGALRLYKGRAGVVVPAGKQEAYAAMLKKYGSVSLPEL